MPSERVAPVSSALSGRITAASLTADKDYSSTDLCSSVNAQRNCSTIEAGTTIYGLKDPGAPGTLIVDRGSKLEANGTKCQSSLPLTNSKASATTVTGVV